MIEVVKGAGEPPPLPPPKERPRRIDRRFRKDKISEESIQLYEILRNLKKGDKFTIKRPARVAMRIACAMESRVAKEENRPPRKFVHRIIGNDEGTDIFVVE